MNPPIEPAAASLRTPIRRSALAPFQQRSYRLQWPADVATSWAFEMETLILGWYVLVETRSVLLLSLFASLQYLGTLLAPLYGVMGDRVGHRTLLCAMRVVYACMAGALMVLSFSGVLSPVYVFMVAAVTGLVRPADIGMRAALVGETMPPAHLMSAMSIQRTTQDSAKIMGALTGAALVATLGMGPAYAVVTSLYSISLLLLLSIRTAPRGHEQALTDAPAPRASPWRELKEGVTYVWKSPVLLATMYLAFMMNLTAFPLFTGLLPYVAKEIYHTTQTGLGYMTAGAAFGALMGSIALSRYGGNIASGRMTLGFCGMWYAMLLVFSQLNYPAAGILALVFAGVAQSLCQIPMVTILLRTCNPELRGRVMGLRMLAIYGNWLGVLISGPLISYFGYPVTAAAYCVIGFASMLIIAMRWSDCLWRRDAAANRP